MSIEQTFNENFEDLVIDTSIDAKENVIKPGAFPLTISFDAYHFAGTEPLHFKIYTTVQGQTDPNRYLNWDSSADLQSGTWVQGFTVASAKRKDIKIKQGKWTSFSEQFTMFIKGDDEYIYDPSGSDNVGLFILFEIPSDNIFLITNPQLIDNNGKEWISNRFFNWIDNDQQLPETWRVSWGAFGDGNVSVFKDKKILDLLVNKESDTAILVYGKTNFTNLALFVRELTGNNVIPKRSAITTVSGLDSGIANKIRPAEIGTGNNLRLKRPNSLDTHHGLLFPFYKEKYSFAPNHHNQLARTDIRIENATGQTSPSNAKRFFFVLRGNWPLDTSATEAIGTSGSRRAWRRCYGLGIQSYSTNTLLGIVYLDDTGEWTSNVALATLDISSDLQNTGTLLEGSLQVAIVGNTLKIWWKSSNSAGWIENYDFKNDLPSLETTDNRLSGKQGYWGSFWYNQEGVDDDNNAIWLNNLKYTTLKQPLPPEKPGIQTVTVLQTTTHTPVILDSSLFIEDDGNTHIATRWQIITDTGDWNSPLIDTEEDTQFLTEKQFSLPESSNFLARVSYKNNLGEWSSWSQPTPFTTGVFTGGIEDPGPGGKIRFTWPASEIPIPDQGVKINLVYNTSTSNLFSIGAERERSKWGPRKLFTLSFSSLSNTQQLTLWNFYRLTKGSFELFNFTDPITNETCIVKFVDNSLEKKHFIASRSEITLQLIEEVIPQTSNIFMFDAT